MPVLKTTFQFHKVRLKVQLTFKCIWYVLFQFHKVRLKVLKNVKPVHFSPVSIP